VLAGAVVKLIFLCRRRPDVTHERYVELLLAGHVPIALRHHPAMRKYVVNVVEQTPPGEEELDSIGELFFDSLVDFRERLYDSAEGRAIVERDTRGFLGAAHAYVTTEHVQKEGALGVALGTRSPGVKLICPVQRREGMTHAEFVAHWLGRHVPLALRHHPGLGRYVTNVVEQRLSPGGEAWDGVAELQFFGQRDLEHGLFDSPAGERVIREDIARFIGRTGAYRVAEYVQKLPR
jgi:uncharacterized protein (TIGR02118 family)